MGCGDPSEVLRSQKKFLKKLQIEKSDLLNELKTVQCPARNAHETKNVTKIVKLIGEHDELTKRLRNDKLALADLKFDLLQAQKTLKSVSLRETKKIALESDAAERQRIDLQRLETRLETETKSLDGLVARNRTICRRIEHLVLLRLQFVKNWQTLAADLCAGKKYSTEVLEYVQEAYVSRQQWHNKLEIVKQKTENAKLTFENEMNSIRRDLDHDLALYRFIDIKTQQRALVDYDRKRTERENRDRRMLETQIDNYEQVLAQIKDNNDEDNVDSLCLLFRRREADNMADFGYANDQNNEIEKLRKSINQLTILIDNENRNNNSIGDKHRSTIEQLSRQLNRLNETERKSSAKLAQQRDQITGYFNDLETIFAMLQCSNEPILKVLGNTAHISVHNVSMFLGLIEEKVMDLLLARGFFNYKENSKRLDFNDDDDDDADADEQISLARSDTACQQMCSRCLLQEKLNDINDDLETVRNRNDILELLGDKLKRPDIKKALHRESVCQLPTLTPK